jgi:hypothetical protein
MKNPIVLSKKLNLINFIIPLFYVAFALLFLLIIAQAITYDYPYFFDNLLKL